MFPPTFPTDRDEYSPDVGVGVDTVAVVGPTTDELLFELRHQQLMRDINYDTGEIVETTGLAKADVQIGLAWARIHAYRRENDTWVRLEVSLPTMLNGHNRNAMSLSLLPDALDAALGSLAFDLPDVPSLEQTKVQRLDLTRDFSRLVAPSSTLAALAARHVGHARHHARQYRPDGQLQSVTRGSKRQYVVRGYDKAYELLDASKKHHDDDGTLLAAWAAVSAGQLRFELRLRAPLLRRKDLLTVDDLTQQSLNNLAEEYFVKARWDMPYGGTGRVQQKLEELRAEMTPADWRSLCAFLFCTQRGMAQPLSRHVLEKVRPVARQHNLLDVEDDHGTRRLDFAEGVEIEEP